MAQSNVNMSKLKRLFQMLAAKIPQRTIWEQLHMGRGILNRYKPAFNEAAVEWVAYYDTSLQTCRIRTPRDKGPVEGLVQKTYNAVYALLHDEVFYNLQNNYSVPYQYVGQKYAPNPRREIREKVRHYRLAASHCQMVWLHRWSYLGRYHSRTEILVPLAVIAWYRLQRYVWYRYSAIVT